MTANGTLYRLQKLAPRTAGKGSGSSPAYNLGLVKKPTHSVPTPTASDHIERKSTSKEKLNFETNKTVSLDRWRRCSQRHRQGLEGHARHGKDGDKSRRNKAKQDGPASQSGVCLRAYGQQWETEPGVGRVAHGISRRVDRLKGLGNAVVPQIVELIGRRIMEIEGSL